MTQDFQFIWIVFSRLCINLQFYNRFEGDGPLSWLQKENVSMQFLILLKFYFISVEIIKKLFVEMLTSDLFALNGLLNACGQVNRPYWSRRKFCGLNLESR